MSSKNSKADLAPPQSSSFLQTFSGGASDTFQRRSGSSGSHGAGASTRHASQPRNSQPLRKQHKAQRRARLADEDAMAESAALRSLNSRRGQTSITHLMNFSLPPRPSYQHQHYPPHRRNQRANPTWGLGSGYHAVDKARYVHANYRFIVRPDKEYHAQTVDADVHVGWDSVLQILASAALQGTSCPICLSAPVAPRMAKCGHIFCLPCLIRYMHSTDDTNPIPEKKARWKKCPICEDSIYVSETRSVRWFEGQEASLLREGGDVLLKLLMREPGKALALPRDTQEALGNQEDIPWYNVVDMMDYARFLKGGEKYMNAEYDQEIHELEAQEKEDEVMFGEDSTWFRKAINSINDAKQRLEGLGDPPDDVQQSKDKKPKKEPIIFNPGEAGPDMYNRSRIPPGGPAPRQNDVSGRQIGSAALQDVSNKLQDLRVDDDNGYDPNEPALHMSGSSARPPNYPFFFYHALPNFYLSPLDIRILRVAFGDFSQFPTTILPRVEHISTGHVVDDDLRKRAKYMAHLPYGAEVSFLECDWTDVLSPRILEQFHDDIERRRKRNHDKEAREERERLRAERQEDEKRLAAVRRRRPSIVEKSFSESDFVPLATTEQTLGTSPGDADAFSRSPPWGTSRTHSSFATLATPGTSPDAARTVWGTAYIAPSSPSMPAPVQDPPNLPHDDGWLQGWEKDLLDQSDSAVLEASLEGPRPSQPSKKKKGKKITLMSTTARRGA